MPPIPRILPLLVFAAAYAAPAWGSRRGPSADCIPQGLASALSSPTHTSGPQLSSLFSRLPARGSKEWNDSVQAMRAAFRENGSHALVDASRSILPEEAEALYRSLPHEHAPQIHYGNILYEDKDEKLVRSAASPEQLQALDRLTTWIGDLVGEALGSHRVQSPYVNLRLSNSKKSGIQFEKWHADGGDISVILPLKGTGTDILGPAPRSEGPREYHNLRGEEWEAFLGKKDFQRVPVLHFWIFTGTEAPQPTIHRSPHVRDEERMILVIRFSTRSPSP